MKIENVNLNMCVVSLYTLFMDVYLKKRKRNKKRYWGKGFKILYETLHQVGPYTTIRVVKFSF